MPPLIPPLIATLSEEASRTTVVLDVLHGNTDKTRGWGRYENVIPLVKKSCPLIVRSTNTDVELSGAVGDVQMSCSSESISAVTTTPIGCWSDEVKRQSVFSSNNYTSATCYWSMGWNQLHHNRFNVISEMAYWNNVRHIRR
mmetsp:Transcript_39329/g.59111  ORF Transcript_39329/g.59111 Transcript_39329/m.59111 type:complete len:142 (-) Transcript_39329:804-1229(-)